MSHASSYNHFNNSVDDWKFQSSEMFIVNAKPKLMVVFLSTVNSQYVERSVCLKYENNYKQICLVITSTLKSEFSLLP